MSKGKETNTVRKKEKQKCWGSNVFFYHELNNVGGFKQALTAIYAPTQVFSFILFDYTSAQAEAMLDITKSSPN